MKFQTDRKPTSFLNRPDQYRLLAMVAALGVVIVAVQWAARPGSWSWLVPPQSSVEDSTGSLKDLDFRVRDMPEGPLPPGTFRAVLRDDTTQTVSESPAAISESPSVGIPAELLEPIEDNTFGLRRKEAAAFETMLSRVQTLPEETIARHAREDVAFTVLMLYPEEYRGTLLTVRGELRLLNEIAASEAAGSDTLYEGWLLTRDSGTNPYRIVTVHAPDDLPLGQTLDPPLPVRVSGYFLKRYGYASRGGQHVAPMLVAKSIHVLPRPTGVVAAGHEFHLIMLIVIGVVLAGVLMLCTGYFASDRRFRRSRMNQLAAARLNATPEDLAALQHVKTIDPERPFAAGESDFDE
jgi:hypothetical protein